MLSTQSILKVRNFSDISWKYCSLISCFWSNERQLEDTSSLVREIFPAPVTRAIHRREREHKGPEALLAEPISEVNTEISQKILTWIRFQHLSISTQEIKFHYIKKFLWKFHI